MNTQSKTGTKTEEPIPGLRDFIAVSALSVLSNSKLSFFQKEDQYKFSWPDQEAVAEFAYRIADAMLKEREKDLAK